MTDQTLRVTDLRVSFRTDGGLVRAVRGIDFELESGEILAIVGESGSGKSATAMALTALNRTSNAALEGSVNFGGRELLTASEDELRSVRGAEIAMIFQDPMTSLTPVHRVGALIAEVLRAHEPLSDREAEKRAIELLSAVGISDARERSKNYPHEFSGGMRQRVMIAMALACHPAVLIADEPTTALDVTIQAQILRLIRRMRAEVDAAVLLITHDLGVVAEVADRVAVMYAGRIVEQGTTDEVFSNPQHPYTLGLLASVPRTDRPRSKMLKAIPGQPIAMTSDDIGCAFAARCGSAFAQCHERPTLLACSDGGSHLAACWLSDQQRTKLQAEVEDDSA